MQFVIITTFYCLFLCSFCLFFIHNIFFVSLSHLMTQDEYKCRGISSSLYLHKKRRTKKLMEPSYSLNIHQNRIAYTELFMASFGIKSEGNMRKNQPDIR